MSKRSRKLIDGVLLPVLAIVSLCMAIVSCAGEGCTSGTSSVPRAGFYSSATGDAITIDSLSGYGVDVPGDSMLLRCQRNVHQTYLPLRISEGTSKFVIHYDQKDISDIRYNDTITLHYEAKPHFESDECGVFYMFDITGYECTNHFVESMELVYPHVSNIDVETIKLFFRTKE